MRQIDALKKAKDEGNDEKSTSLQIKLNGKEAELERMENLLIEMHKKMDTVKEEQVAAEIECKETTKSYLRLEKELEVVQQDAKAERRIWERQIEDIESKLNEATVKVYRKDLTIQGLEKQQMALEQEVERLKKVKDIGESVARLPAACLDDLTSTTKVKEAKASALHDALMDLKSKDKGRNDLIDKIEELEERQKRAYLRLYERVGQEIGTSMHKSLEEREKVIMKEQDEMEDLEVEDLEMKRLRAAQENAQRKKQESVTLQDLFNKYGI